MNAVSISDIYNDNILIDSNITICGWIRSRRTTKADFSFLMVYDGSCFENIQVIVEKSILNYETEILSLTIGCSVQIKGMLILSIGNQQKYEIKAERVKVLGWIEQPHTYPMSLKKHSLEHLREFSHLRSRTNLIGSIVRIRHHVLQTIHRFLCKKGYFWIPTPIITGLNAEGAGEMFRVSTLNLNDIAIKKNYTCDFKEDFFGKESFLTVSGQLTLEAYACSLSKVYTFGPTFRAENSNTSRHLAEFWMLEVESAFTNMNEIACFAEKMLKYIFKSVLISSMSDILFLKKNIDNDILNRLEQLLLVDFIRIEYTDVIDILINANIKFKKKIFLGMDLSTEHERYIVEKYFKIPVIIQNYPKVIKPFYMRLNDDKKTVAAIDILVPGIGELIGGSQREERISVLDARLLELELKKEDYWWYRDLRRYGTVPHSGFGMGFERLISYITGVSNIRDVIPFPRTAHNAHF